MELNLNSEKVKAIVSNALKEDIGKGDITTEKIIPKDIVTNAYIVSKEKGVIAGLPIIDIVYDGLKIDNKIKDGDLVTENETILELEGSAREIISRERVTLNLLSHLSGIATYTKKVVDKVKDYGVLILDTRKTMPGIRALEKYAVLCGGGENHRFGLDDQILIKDNHLEIIKRFGNDYISKAVGKCKDELVEIEVTNILHAEEAVSAGANILLLDNMNIDCIKQIVKEFKGKVILEVSGGVTLDNIEEYAKTGIDRISMGALTHSSNSLDLSLRIE